MKHQHALKDYDKSHHDGEPRPKMKKKSGKSGFEKIRHRRNFTLSDIDDIVE